MLQYLDQWLVHPPCIQEVPGSNLIKCLLHLGRVLPKDYKKLVVAVSLLGTQ